jgi:hypothetical protein
MARKIADKYFSRYESALQEQVTEVFYNFKYYFRTSLCAKGPKVGSYLF